MLDLAAKLDSTAEFLCKKQWGDIDFPPPFGRDALPEVRSILSYMLSNISPLLFCIIIDNRDYVAGIGNKSHDAYDPRFTRSAHCLQTREWLWLLVGAHVKVVDPTIRGVATV